MNDASVPPPVIESPPANPANVAVVKNQSPAAVQDLPLSFARPFRQGEIASFPVVYVDGAPLPTQADVKQRWPDGSVRHAILSVVLPTLAAGASASLTFGAQANGNNVAPADAILLGSDFDFDATITLTSGENTVSASARQMLMDGRAVKWMSGPIATTLILADHSATRTYDLGFDQHRSVRPIFEATFWPTLKKVRVRFIGENGNSTTLQDVRYDLRLATGKAAPAQVYSKTGVVMPFGTRWTKVAWAPSAPAREISLDHGLAYLASTQFIPNFDPTATISEAQIVNAFDKWSQRPRDLYEAGSWTRYMPTTGGRAEIGPYPTWTGMWLYTGDYRAQEIAFGQADLAAAWPMNFREGDPAAKFDRAKTIDGIGKPLSINQHPTRWFPNNSGAYSPILPTPRIQDPNASAWKPDGGHMPDPFSPQYLLTGEHFYLEELQLWAATHVFSYAPGGYGRGVDGYAGIQDQIRGNAWVLRNRCNAAFLSPDGTPERNYFREIVEDAIALWEGQRNITGTTFSSHPQWAYGHDKIPSPPSPLRFWSRGNPVGSGGGIDPTKASRTAPLWMEYFLLIELGRARERGFPVGALLSWHAPLLAAQMTTPGYDPRWSATYGTPIVDENGVPFASFADVADAMLPSLRTSGEAAYAPPGHYAIVAAAAGAMIRNETGGDTAWTWLDTNVHAKTNYVPGSITWNIVPRIPAPPPLPAP